MGKFSSFLKLMRPMVGKSFGKPIFRNTDDIKHFTKLEGANTFSGATQLTRISNEYNKYNPLYGMPNSRVGKLFGALEANYMADPPKPTRMIKDIYGNRVPYLRSAGYHTPVVPLNPTDPGISTNIKVPNLYQYTRPVSAKGLSLPFQQKMLHSNMRDVGTVRPIEWANAEAGDPNYARKAMDSIYKYLDDTNNDFIKDPILTDKYGSPTYVNRNTGQIAVPEMLWAQMNRRHPYVQNEYLPPFTMADKRIAVIPAYNKNNLMPPNRARAKALDNPWFRHETPLNAPVPTDLSSYVDAHYIPKNFGRLHKGTKDSLTAAQFAGHEIGHLGTLDYISTGAIPGDWLPNRRIPVLYHRNSVELGQAGAHFKRQHARNTGIIINSGKAFDDAIAYARKHINDYDPESRRFLMSLDGQAQELNGLTNKKRKLVYPGGSTTAGEANSMYNIMRNAVPLLFGGAAVPTTALMRNNHDEDIRNITNGQR